MPSASEMIATIRQAFNVKEETLGQRLGVTQETINRWYNEKASPTKSHMNGLIDLFEIAKQKLADVPLESAEFEYVCSFASQYTQELITEGMDALRRVFPRSQDVSMKGNPAVKANIDFFVRAVTLSPSVRAHTFQERRSNPRVFVVLVNDKLSEMEQLQVAWDEAFAHVMNRLMATKKTVRPPRPVIRNKGR